ncbi:primosomal protein N' [Alicyclobacillus acidiphilus]|uniref:primosomal protein N' n=1 Tax=Alicyclobacillus acidiphilus TaxID=182455 RepID=UPI000831638E|nr:primosomal protein N' [Alicyclobacillus acidiphilus]
MSDGTVAQVIVESPGLFMDKPFDYRITPEQLRFLRPGMRVVVPFRKDVKPAIVWRLHHVDAVSEKIRPIISVVDESPILTEEQLSLAQWLCDRYACTIQDALGAILPGAFRVRGRMRMVVVDDDSVPDDVRSTRLWQWIAAQRPDEAQVMQAFGDKARHQVRGWMDAVYLRQELDVRERVQQATKSFLLPCVGPDELLAEAAVRDRRAAKQAELLRALAEAEQGELLWSRSTYPGSTVQSLVRDGLLRIEERTISRFTWDDKAIPSTPPVLTEAQERALQQIRLSRRANGHKTVVLHGVTGSGKTEIYMRAIEDTLEQGMQVIVLVPEIALTPQMVGRFYARFGERIAVLHSALTPGERRDEWMRILEGRADIVIGARSAVFAPIQNLGLVVVDEEHEPSYKQDESPHYDAREVALERAANAGAMAILGSATPSLWAIRMSETGRAKIVSLPTRANRKALPTVELIDMRNELRSRNKSLFSARLQEEMARTVEMGKQVVLFLNRRGYANSMLCRACGESVHCPNCDISLTVHKSAAGHVLICHYCGFQQPYQDVCGFCHEPAMRAFGIGTEQIEEAIHRMWPSYRVLRMDVDTTRKKGSLKRIVDDFEHGRADILIGTQMIAKGLDFPNVRLVGVVAADTMLSVPDYRAHERTFQLLTQVAGRAGRADTEGLTIIQTYRPEHFSIQAAAKHDFAAFYREEREQREFFAYPPFCELAVFVATHTEEKLAKGAAMRFERELRRTADGNALSVLPAVPSGIRRIENQYRFQVVLKYEHWQDVQQSVTAAYRLVKERMNRLGGTCRLDVNAQRIG